MIRGDHCGGIDRRDEPGVKRRISPEFSAWRAYPDRRTCRGVSGSDAVCVRRADHNLIGKRVAGIEIRAFAGQTGKCSICQRLRGIRMVAIARCTYVEKSIARRLDIQRAFAPAKIGDTGEILSFVKGIDQNIAGGADTETLIENEDVAAVGVGSRSTQRIKESLLGLRRHREQIESFEPRPGRHACPSHRVPRHGDETADAGAVIAGRSGIGRIGGAVYEIPGASGNDVRGEVLVSDFKAAVDHRRDDAVAGETEGAEYRLDIDVHAGNAGSVGKGVLSSVLQMPLLRGERIAEGTDREGVVAIHADVGHVGRPHRARAVRHSAALGRAGRLRAHRHGIGRAGKDRRAEAERTVAADRKIVPAVVPQHQTRARQPAHRAADREAVGGAVGAAIPAPGEASRCNQKGNSQSKLHNSARCATAARLVNFPGQGRRAKFREPDQRSRAASWKALVTGERRYSSTVRVPRWISADTCMPGARLYFSPSAWRYWLLRFTSVL